MTPKFLHTFARELTLRATLSEPFEVWINPNDIKYIRWSEEHSLYLCVVGNSAFFLDCDVVNNELI
jgi:hypothetical protein